MRIWHQSFTVLDESGPYRDALARHVGRVARAGVTVDLHGVDPATYAGTYPGGHLAHVYLQNRHKEQVVAAALSAAAEGYDAYFLATAIDTGYEEMRTLVDIPVVAYGHASLALASAVGDRVGIVTFIPDLTAQFQRNALTYGFGGLLGPVVPIEADFGDLMQAYARPGRILDAFHVSARRAIEAGANVLVPGEGPLNMLLADQGLARVDDVPVIDSIGAGVKLCESLVDLRRSSGLAPHRRGIYGAAPPPELVERVRAFYDGKGA